MKVFLLCSAIIYLSTYFACGAEVNSPCDGHGWIPYKDEKCVKLFTTFETRQRAEEVCNRERLSNDPFVPTLVSIRSLDEQKFLTDYVFNSSDSKHIWIGAERRLGSGTEFTWVDGSPIQRFTYWDISRPTDDVRRSCVLLQSSLSSRQSSDLRWIDVSCTTANWFICEKLQVWPVEHFQQTMLSIRRDLQYIVSEIADAKMIDELRKNLTSQAAVLRNLQENPVSIGFVYVQLSGQPEPQDVWKTVKWTEITSTYEGLFFRAAGGNAAVFGSTQTENSPRLTGVWRDTLSSTVNLINTVLGALSPTVSTGLNPGTGTHSGLRFIVSSGEVRPRNQAVRIWKRIQ